MTEFSIEIKRAFRGRAFKLSLLAGLALALVQFIMLGLLPGEGLEELREHGISLVMMGPRNVHNWWLGGELNSFYSSIFWAIFPILVALPFARSYYMDRRYGRIKNVLTRTKPRTYYWSIWVANFIVSGVVASLPLILSLLLHLTQATWMKPFVETSTFEVGYQSSARMFYLFYNQPGLYLLVYFVNIFIFAGLLSNLGLAAVSLEDRAYIPLLVPFALWLFTDLMALLYPSFFISLKDYLNPVGGTITLARSLGLMLLLFLLSAVPLGYQYKYKKDF